MPTTVASSTRYLGILDSYEKVQRLDAFVGFSEHLVLLILGARNLSDTKSTLNKSLFAVKL